LETDHHIDPISHVGHTLSIPHLSEHVYHHHTARDCLASLGDDDNTYYLTIFKLMMPASLLGFPLVDATLHRFGGLQLANALAAIHGIIQVSSTNLNVQVLGFVVFSFYRSFLFSVVLFSLYQMFWVERWLAKPMVFFKGHRVSRAFLTFP
jgi:hypothetical protein